MSAFTEWCVWYGGDDPNECAGLLTYDSEAEAAEMTQWIDGGRVASRIVWCEAWQAEDRPHPEGSGVGGGSAAS